MKEICQALNSYLTQMFDSFNKSVERIQSIVRKEYAEGTPEEKELAPYIFIEFDIETYEVKVKIPSGVNSKGEKFLNTIVGREFGKFGIEPQVTILRYLK